MRVPPVASVAVLSGALGLLGVSHDDFRAEASRTAVPSPAVAEYSTRQPEQSGTAPVTLSTYSASPRGDGGVSVSGAQGRAWWHERLQPLRSLLPPTAALADGSGYDAMTPLPASGSSGAALAHGAGIAEDGWSDTISGVFHRLDPARAKLVLVQVVFRHGARTPLSNRRDLQEGVAWDVCGEAYKAAAVRVFSTAGVEDPVSRHDLKQRSTVYPGGCHKGELTLVGQAQARQLGAALRQRYVSGAAAAAGAAGFLPEAHSPGVLEARTTNTSRTRASLRGVLTGLYPELAEAGAPPQRVTTSSDLDEILYADVRTCPHLAAIQAVARESGRAALRADPEYEWAKGEMSRLLGIEPATFDTAPWVFTDVHDVLTSLAAHGKPLPPGLRQGPGLGGGQGVADVPRLLAAINRLATKEFSAEVSPGLRDSTGRTVLRLSMGRLLHILTHNMRRAARQGAAGADDGAGAGTGAGPEAGPRMYLYSGHDSTIMPLLSALGHEVSSWPPYMSNLVIELWRLEPHEGAGGGGGGGSSGEADPGGSPRYAVRVLRDLEDLHLPHCPPGYLPSLSTFEREVVGPFLLSTEGHAQLCRVRVGHDGSMPTPTPKHQSA